LSPAIAAIIVSYQSASTLDACLLRLREARDIAEIRVVDNDSTDGTLEIVQRHASADPRVRFIANPDNPGFAAANNQGVADSQAPWLAFINPDLMVGPETLMPRALFERIGGWDAGYRLHAEDLDLCRRAREAGAVIAIANDLQVTHVRGVSSRSRPFFVEWHKHRGLWRYFQKFEAPQRAWPVRCAVWGAIWAHALVQVPRLLRRR